MTNATPAVTLTKEEKLVAIDAQIAKLHQRRHNIENDIVVVKTPKAVVLPELGALVAFSYGRKTATTSPVAKQGTVVAIKPSIELEGGKRAPAQIKVQIGEGFDTEFVVIYPAQLVTPAPTWTTPVVSRATSTANPEADADVQDAA